MLNIRPSAANRQSIAHCLEVTLYIEWTVYSDKHLLIVLETIVEVGVVDG